MSTKEKVAYFGVFNKLIYRGVTASCCQQPAICIYLAVTQTAPPAMPGGVRIKYIDVAGGFLDDPILIREPIESDYQSSGMEPDASQHVFRYSVIVANFSVTYVVDDCRHGISLIQGNYVIEGHEETLSIWVERAAAGTPPVTGTFDLTFNGQTIGNIDAEISEDVMENLLEINFFEEGGEQVSCT